MSDTATAPPQLVLRIVRPASGVALAPGQALSGIGWLACNEEVSAVSAGFEGHALAPVRHGLSQAEFEALAGCSQPEAPPGTVTCFGFVFRLRVPDGPPGPARLRFELRTGRGRLAAFHGVAIRGEAQPALPTLPLDRATAPLALIERAAMDGRMVLNLSGWAVAPGGVRAVQVALGGRDAGEAQYGLARTDVAAAHPSMHEPHRAGFVFHQELADEELGAGTVRVTIIGNDGMSVMLDAPVAMPPTHRRRRAPDVADMQCDDIALAADGGLGIKGWAVCGSPIKAIRIVLDEEEVGSVVPGESRPDVGNRFPQIRAARQAGFRFARALGRSVTGQHVLELALEGEDGRVHTVSHILATQPALPEMFAALLPPAEVVVAPSSSVVGRGPPICTYLDAPTVLDGKAVTPVRGFLAVSGWAAARSRIDRVELFVDGVSLGRVHHGIRREDVAEALPGYNALLSGFAMMIPPQVMRPGSHDIRIVFADAEGAEAAIGFSLVAERADAGTGPWTLRRRLPQSEVDLLKAILTARGGVPRWHVVIGCGGADAAALAATVQSLLDQALPDWVATVLTPPSMAPSAELAAVADLCPGRLAFAEAVPGKKLAALAEGAAWLMVLAAGDRLGEDALIEMSVESALNPDADFLYCDEIRADPIDGETKAFFKPDWSPELLLSMDYVGRPWAARPALVAAAGLPASQCLPGGEYDAVLRLTEIARGIHHVPKVLGATVRGRGRGGRRALEAAMRRRGASARVTPWLADGIWRVQRSGDSDALVSIIIPTIASRGLIETAIGSIRRLTAWRHYEIVCLDNIPQGGTPEQQRWKEWIAAHADRTVEVTHRFNWSRSNNRGVRAAKGAFLLFLNDDIEVLEPDWLHRLVEQAQRPEVGVVGPQLLYPDGRVQHAGMFLARRGARHAFRFYPRDEPGNFGLARVQRDVISVTGACMMMRRDVYDALGGFDEKHAVINNDLDFNLRAGKAGYRVIYTPYVTLVHHEMASRAQLREAFDSASFRAAWSDVFLKGDPYLSPHVSTEFDDLVADTEPVRQFTVGHAVLASEAIRRILAVKVDHIGDFITAFPAFRRIKQHFPNAELTVLVPKASAALAAMEPAIDRVIEFNYFHARSEKGLRSGTAKALRSLEAELSRERFDIAIDLRRQADTRQILTHTGARWLAGFDRGFQFPWLDFTVEFEGDLANRRKREHVVDSLVHLVDAVAANCQSDRSILAHPPDRDGARQRLAALLQADGIAAARLGTPLVCVHTGAGSLNKQWPAAYFAGLIDLLMREAAASVMVIGGADESGFVAGLLKLVGDPAAVLNLVGRVPLAELPGILAAADLYVGNDSGPKHIAAAVGIPTVGIHSGSVDAGEWGPMGPRAIAIHREVKCSPCYIARASDCHRGLACLTGIAVADVWRACRRLLALAPDPGVPPPPKRRSGAQKRTGA